MTSKDFKMHFPELNQNQFKLLHKMVADEVIQEDESTRSLGAMARGVSEQYALGTKARNALKAEARTRLAELMGVKNDDN